MDTTRRETSAGRDFHPAREPQRARRTEHGEREEHIEVVVRAEPPEETVGRVRESPQRVQRAPEVAVAERDRNEHADQEPPDVFVGETEPFFVGSVRLGSFAESPRNRAREQHGDTDAGQQRAERSGGGPPHGELPEHVGVRPECERRRVLDGVAEQAPPAESQPVERGERLVGKQQKSAGHDPIVRQRHPDERESGHGDGGVSAHGGDQSRALSRPDGARERPAGVEHERKSEQHGGVRSRKEGDADGRASERGVFHAPTANRADVTEREQQIEQRRRRVGEKDRRREQEERRGEEEENGEHASVKIIRLAGKEGNQRGVGGGDGGERQARKSDGEGGREDGRGHGRVLRVESSAVTDEKPRVNGLWMSCREPELPIEQEGGLLEIDRLVVVARMVGEQFGGDDEDERAREQREHEERHHPSRAVGSSEAGAVGPPHVGTHPRSSRSSARGNHASPCSAVSSTVTDASRSTRVAWLCMHSTVSPLRSSTRYNTEGPR